MFLYLLIFVVGTFVGSFLNILIDRLKRGETIVWGSSYCEKCGHKLVWNDLVPILSYLGLSGHCRYCRSPIPFWLPVVELVTGLLFVLVVLVLQFLISDFSWLSIATLLHYYIVSSLLLVIFFSDLKYHLIYDQIIYPAIGVTLAYRIFEAFSGMNTYFFSSYAMHNTLYNYILSSLLAAAFFYLLYGLGPKLFHKDTMGLGDVKLSILIGLLLGYPKIIVALYLAFLTGALVGVTLIAAKKAKMKSQIAFGPFLVGATFIVWFWGEKIINKFLISNF